MDKTHGPDFARLKWPLVALWISIGLHGALIALVKIVPPRQSLSANPIEARLLPGIQTHPAPLSLPDLKSPAMDDVLAYAPPPTPATQTNTQQLPAPPTQESPIPQIEVPLAVDLHYYSARELDVTPSGIIPDPVLPETLSGKIKYQVKIEEDGRVSNVEVLSVELADGANPAALANTEAMLRATRFRPGIKNGRPVRSVVVYVLTINPVVSQ